MILLIIVLRLLNLFGAISMLYGVRLINIGSIYHFKTYEEALEFSKRCGFENVIEEVQKKSGAK